MKIKAHQEHQQARRIVCDPIDPKPPEIVGVARNATQALIIRFDSRRNLLTVEWQKDGRTYVFDNPAHSYLLWICDQGGDPSFGALRQRIEQTIPQKELTPRVKETRHAA